MRRWLSASQKAIAQEGRDHEKTFIGNNNESLQKDTNISELSEVEAEIESIDRAIHLVAVPMPYSDLYFP